MGDVFWAAMISAGAAVISAVLTNFFNARSTARQLAHTAQEAERDWRRTEATRKAVEARDLALREEQSQADHLRRFWEHVLEARLQMEGVFLYWNGGATLMEKYPVEPMPLTCALRAYAVALLDLPTVFPAAQKWFHAVADVQDEVRRRSYERAVAVLPNEERAYWDLMKVVASQSGVVLDIGERTPDSDAAAAVPSSKPD